MSAFALALGSLLTGLCVLGGVVVYVLTAANRVEKRQSDYAGDGRPLSQSRDAPDRIVDNE